MGGVRRSARALVAASALATAAAPARADDGELTATVSAWTGGMEKRPGALVRGWLEADTAVMPGARRHPAPMLGVRGELHLRERDDANSFAVEARAGVGRIGTARRWPVTVAAYGLVRHVHDVRVRSELPNLRSIVGVGVGGAVWAGPFFTQVALVFYPGGNDHDLGDLRFGGGLGDRGGAEVTFGSGLGGVYLVTTLRTDAAWGLGAGAGLVVRFGAPRARVGADQASSAVSGTSRTTTDFDAGVLEPTATAPRGTTALASGK
ncbi:MAG: hypothetical protein R2939_10335 [Kofleriaceae bacterium]